MKIWTLIESEKEYRAVLNQIDKLFSELPLSGTRKDKELKLLIHLADKFEDEHYPISNPDPIDAIKIRMRDLSLSARDLVSCMGDKGTVSKILSRQRMLSLEMIRKLESKLQLPASVLIQKPKLANRKIKKVAVKRKSMV
jgi:HTH-type transcriptional regulator/antitoxin HigA